MTQPIDKSKDVWIYGEVRHGKLVSTAYELLHVARGLADTLGEKVVAVIMGKGVTPLAQDLIDHGADKVFVIDHPALENFVDEVHTAALVELIKKECPNKMLMPASTIGRSFASRVAVSADTGITADATELTINPETKLMHATRPAFGGNLMATILCKNHRPEMATVRPMSFPKSPKQEGRKGEIVSVAYTDKPARTRFVRFEPATHQGADIQAAETLVSGGRGVGGKEGFQALEALANELNGAVGASRAAVDAGWIEYRNQVGLTGRTVRPKLYIAAGISGQIQHLAGMTSSEIIVAVNKDPECPMMRLATLSVEGDLFEVIPAITAEIKKRRG
jgi:electron transfer flavoprotein alpha subunit